MHPQARNGGRRIALLCQVWCILGAGLVAAAAQTPPQSHPVVRLFVGNAQKPEILRQIAAQYEQRNAGVKVEIETGGETVERQQAMLNGVFAQKGAAIDLVLIDAIRLPQWAAAQWIEPLDAYLGAERASVLERYLLPYRSLPLVNGKIYALPVMGDAQFLYYRKDLLEKHAIALPRTWEDMKNAIQKIQMAENRPDLQGLAIAAAPVESAVCSYLTPLWGLGRDLIENGRLDAGPEFLAHPLQHWGALRAAGLMPANLGEIASERIRQDLQAGNLIFGFGWGYMWNRLDRDEGSRVQGAIGVAAVPGFAPEGASTCLGGWQAALSAFSKNKVEAVKFARFLASPEVAKRLAIEAGTLPVFSALYADAEVLAANPWFAQALPAMQAAKARPATARYGEVSMVMRGTMSAFFAGTKTAEAAASELGERLKFLLREREGAANPPTR